MAELIKQYTNATYTSGIQVTEATPIDDRLLIHSESALLQLFDPLSTINKSMITAMYDGMIIQVKESRREYIWVETDFGLIPGGYTYPAYADGIAGQDYADKTYNLVIFDKVNKVDITYSDITDEGLFIPTELLPFQLQKDIASAVVTFKSSATSFEELEYPDKLVVKATGLMIILDPKPAVSEVFKITIS